MDLLQNEIQSLNQKNVNLEATIRNYQEVEEAKNLEISQLKSKNHQTEMVAQQLNQQLAQLQQQIDIYKQQMGQYENANLSNQQQLAGRLQQHEMTIQILVEEKGELNTRVRTLEEIDINTKAELENSRLGL